MSRSTPKQPPRVHNKKAARRYEILERVECGIVLAGTEVKSLRQGQASLDEAHARIRDSEVWLHGFHISAYTHASVAQHDPLRPRKLLLHRRQINKLAPKVVQRGLTLVPLCVFFSDRGIAKVELALVRGKAQRDKRQDLKKRDDKREMDRAMRRRR